MPVPGYIPRAPNPVIAPDLRSHKVAWHEFELRAGRSPSASIYFYWARFLAAAGVMISAAFLVGDRIHGDPKRILLALLSVWAAGYSCLWLFIIAHQFRWLLSVVSAVVLIWFLWQQEYHATRICLWTLAANILIAIWASLEINAWNRELRAAGLSSEKDIWDITQFPPKRA